MKIYQLRWWPFLLLASALTVGVVLFESTQPEGVFVNYYGDEMRNGEAEVLPPFENSPYEHLRHAQPVPDVLLAGW